VSTAEPDERPGYNRVDPRSPFCLESDQGARSFSSEDVEALMRRKRGPDACELTELDITRGIARRLRAELIYGMPADAQLYTEQDIPTSRNLPMFMEFIFELLAAKKDPGPRGE
jgi:hypothetical protein